MNQLRYRIQQIAKARIIKSQIKNTVHKTKKNKSKSNKEQIVDPPREQKVFFPKVPVGFFGYSRPREARLATQKEREQTKQFLLDLEKLNKKNIQTKTKKISYVHPDFYSNAKKTPKGAKTNN